MVSITSPTKDFMHRNHLPKNSKMGQAVLIAYLAVGIALSAAGTIQINNASLSFQLSGRNLPTFDPFGGKPDPYIVINYENPPNPPLKLGETSKLADTQDPVWPEKFTVIYLNGSSQRLTLDLWDEDIDADDFMGNVTVRLDELISTFGGILEKDVVLNNSTSGNGHIIITANVTNMI